jgi:hypothetical protein
MTQKQKKQYEFISVAVDHVLQEMFDGYVLIGFVAGSSGPPMQIVSVNSEMAAHALNHLLTEAHVTCAPEKGN